MISNNFVSFVNDKFAITKNDNFFTQPVKMIGAQLPTAAVGTVAGLTEAALSAVMSVVLTTLSMPIRALQLITPESWTIIQDNVLVNASNGAIKNTGNALANTAKSAGNIFRSTVLGGVYAQETPVQETPVQEEQGDEQVEEEVQAPVVEEVQAPVVKDKKTIAKEMALTGLNKAKEGMINGLYYASNNKAKTAATVATLAGLAATYYFRGEISAFARNAYTKLFVGKEAGIEWKWSPLFGSSAAPYPWPIFHFAEKPLITEAKELLVAHKFKAMSAAALLAGAPALYAARNTKPVQFAGKVAKTGAKNAANIAAEHPKATASIATVLTVGLAGYYFKSDISNFVMDKVEKAKDFYNNFKIEDYAFVKQAKEFVFGKK